MTDSRFDFKIIQGAMGIGVAGWRLAKAVSELGQLGVVSGTGLAVVLARRLQAGDPGGHMRRALEKFPVRGVAERVLQRYFVSGGIGEGEKFRLTPLPQLELGAALTELTVVANWAEVYLAKEDHDGVVGIEYMENVQTPTLASLYGAMLAGVDYVLMGSGMPVFVPGVLERIAQGVPTELALEVTGQDEGQAGPEWQKFVSEFSPVKFWGSVGEVPEVKRPAFLAMVGSAELAAALWKKADGRIDGFVIEAAKREGGREDNLDERIAAEAEKMREMGMPFYLGGDYGEPGKLVLALSEGARGVRVETAFAFCQESGVEEDLKRRMIEKCLAQSEEGGEVLAEAWPSPVSWPYEVLELEVAGPVSQETPAHKGGAEGHGGARTCDLGFMRELYRKDDGTIGYRCPGEPVDKYLQKGGKIEDTVGRKCVCNAMFATIGLGKAREAGVQGVLVTADRKVDVAPYLAGSGLSYTAADVVAEFLGERE